MAATLIYLARNGQKHRAEVTSEVTRIGRKPGNHLILEDEVVSGRHAEVHHRGKDYFLVDLESTNGTFVNGERIQKVRLQNRDRIEVGKGGPLIEFRCDESAGAPTPELHPLSGTWESGMTPIRLKHGRTTLGRGLENDIIVGRSPGSVVSSRHAIVIFHAESCEIEDLDSSNGTLVNGRAVRKAGLSNGDKVELGRGGPVFELRWSGAAAPKSRRAAAKQSDQILRKLERAAKGGRAGEQTMLLLQAATKYYKRRRWPLLILSGAVMLLAVVTGVLYYRKARETRQLRASAEEVFYQMRTIESQLVKQRDTMSPEEAARLNNDKLRAEQAYDQFLKNLGVYEGRSPVQVAIMRLARHLGETDLEVPPDFYQTTLSYVQKWRSTSRLRNSLDRARERGLLQVIRTALNQYGLPQEFFFIPLQESGYDLAAVGRPTSYGIAKGMWQLIPSTAVEYGLRLGPLKDVAQYDPSDQRQDELASTQAAVRYLADLFSQRAAASGLLVMASYNYGATRIIKKLESLPNDPRQRNFWNFYRNGWLPSETRDYVMSIFSAALVCEKPELFQMNIEPIRPDW